MQVIGAQEVELAYPKWIKKIKKLLNVEALSKIQMYNKIYNLGVLTTSNSFLIEAYLIFCFSNRNITKFMTNYFTIFLHFYNSNEERCIFLKYRLRKLVVFNKLP